MPFGEAPHAGRRRGGGSAGAGRAPSRLDAPSRDRGGFSVVGFEQRALVARQGVELLGVGAVAAVGALELLEALDVPEGDGAGAAAHGACDTVVGSFGIHRVVHRSRLLTGACARPLATSV